MGPNLTPIFPIVLIITPGQAERGGQPPSVCCSKWQENTSWQHSQSQLKTGGDGSGGLRTPQTSIVFR